MGIRRRYGRARRTAWFVALAVLGAAVAPGARAEDGVATGEAYRSPITGITYEARKDAETGAKWLQAPDGTRYATRGDVVRTERLNQPPLERVVAPDILAIAQDTERAAEIVPLTIVMRRQPLHTAAMAARATYVSDAAEIVDRTRAILGRIAPLRTVDPEDGTLDDVLEEEQRLFTADEKKHFEGMSARLAKLRNEYRTEVLADARAAVLADQADLIDHLERTSVHVLSQNVILNSVSARVPAGAIVELVQRFPEIGWIAPVRDGAPELDTSVTSSGAKTWWNAGYDGSSSTKVAVLDWGLDTSHPAFSGAVSNTKVFLQAASQRFDFNDSTTNIDDFDEHGTHVAGIVGSRDSTYAGIAKGASLMIAKVGYRTTSGGANTIESDIFEAVDWSGATGADSISFSIGFPIQSTGLDPLTLVFDAAVFDLLVGVAKSAGNSGPNSGTITSPGDGYNIFAVGNYDDWDTTSQSDDVISSSSSRGPTSDGRRKPDIAAPGSYIKSASHTWEGSSPDFVELSGTSMAAPHVAGALALLADYGVSSVPEGMRALLLCTTNNTSPFPSSPDNTFGWGAMSLGRAYAHRASVAESTLTSSGPQGVYFHPGALQKGDRVTLCWLRHVMENGTSSPNDYSALIDMDLYLYDGRTGATLATSDSFFDPTEQLEAPRDVNEPVVLVWRYDDFPTGVDTEYFAVSAETTTQTNEVALPELACDLRQIGAAGAGTTFTVTADVRNDGELTAVAPDVTLTLPTGFTMASGSPTKRPGPIDGDGAVVVTWSVRSPDPGSGFATFSAVATSSAYYGDVTSNVATAEQINDLLPPTGTVAVVSGGGFSNQRVVTLQLHAVDDPNTDVVTGVQDMRLRNEVDFGFNPWIPFQLSLQWPLTPGDGPKTVFVQFRDGAGNESDVVSADAVLDEVSPTGTFVLNGGSAYALPDVPIVATTTTDDGPFGSGVSEFRIKASGSPFWLAWTPIVDDLAAVDPPSSLSGATTVSGQFRDRAGNLSVAHSVEMHFVDPSSPQLALLKSAVGAHHDRADVDAYRVDYVAGDMLQFRVKVKSGEKRRGFGVAVETVDARGERSGPFRFQTGQKAGWVPYTAADPAATGTVWLMLRATDTSESASGKYVLSLKLKRAKTNVKRTGTAVPVDGIATIPFDAVDGSSVALVLNGVVSGPVEITAPDGSTTAPTTKKRGNKVTLKRHPLNGGTGTYEARVPTSIAVQYKLVLKVKRRGRHVEPK